MKLKDRVALITGSSRGIGRAIAILFAKEGAKIVVNYTKSEDKANEVVKEIKKLGSDAIAVRCDVSKEEQVKEMIKKTIKKFNKLDILVNNAGIVIDLPFEERTVEHWKKTLDTNLIGTFLCCKHSFEYLSKQTSGKIINIASTNGIDSFNPEAIDYDSSKAGIIILTRNLAKEFAPKIHVNAIAPGWVDTDMNKNLPKDYIKGETEKIYLKRFAKPEEIAKVALFLASDDSSFITGTTIKADGGY